MAPEFTAATAVANGRKGGLSTKEKAIEAIRDAFVDGEDIWQHGVEKAARVLVDMMNDEQAANRDKIMAFRELAKHLTSETIVELEDSDGNRIKTGSVEDLEYILSSLQAKKGKEG